MCSLSEVSGRSLLKKGTPRLHLRTISRVSPWFVGLDGCTEVRLCALTLRARIHPTHVLDDIQASFLHCYLKPPSVLPNCMRWCPFVVELWGLIFFERCERLLGQDLPRALWRSEDEPTALHRDGLRSGVRITPTMVALVPNFPLFSEPPNPLSSFRSSLSRSSTLASFGLIRK